MKTKDRKTAAKAAGKWPCWRTTTRKGERVLIDPDGHVYHGTAQEVREAALTPTSRRILANDMEFARRSIFDRFNFTPAERRGYICEKRLDAIRTDRQFRRLGRPITVPADVFILLRAGARLVCDNFDEFLADMFQGELEALQELAQQETGRREIPLTRHERAALDRLRGNSPAGGGL